MPVTVRLSRLFHERLGDEIADELANWFNQVDATYRGDLRELNELNFARFDAKLEQRVVEAGASLERHMLELEVRVEKRMRELEARLEKRITELDVRITKLEAHVNQRFTELEARIEQSADRLRAEFTAALADTRARLMTWIVGLWVTTVLGFAGVLVAVLRAG